MGAGRSPSRVLKPSKVQQKVKQQQIQDTKRRLAQAEQRAAEAEQRAAQAEDMARQKAQQAEQAQMAELEAQQRLFDAEREKLDASKARQRPAAQPGVPKQGGVKQATSSKQRPVTADQKAHEIMRIGDRHQRNGQLTVNEMRTYLSGTPYEAFSKWVSQRGALRAVDLDLSGHLSLPELTTAVRLYLEQAPPEEVDDFLAGRARSLSPSRERPYSTYAEGTASEAQGPAPWQASLRGLDSPNSPRSRGRANAHEGLHSPRSPRRNASGDSRSKSKSPSPSPRHGR